MNKYIELYIYIHKFISIQLYKKSLKKYTWTIKTKHKY